MQPLIDVGRGPDLGLSTMDLVAINAARLDRKQLDFVTSTMAWLGFTPLRPQCRPSSLALEHPNLIFISLKKNYSGDAQQDLPACK